MAGTAARSRTTPANASLRIGFPLLLPALVIVDGINCHDFVQEVAEVYRELLFAASSAAFSSARAPARIPCRPAFPRDTQLEGTDHPCSVFPVLRSVFPVLRSRFSVRPEPHPLPGALPGAFPGRRRDRGRSRRCRPPPRNEAHLAIDGRGQGRDKRGESSKRHHETA